MRDKFCFILGAKAGKQQDKIRVKIIFIFQLNNGVPPSTSIPKRTKVEGGTGAVCSANGARGDKAGTGIKKIKFYH